MHALIAFALAATLLTLTPGLDTALVLRTAAAEGRSSAIQAALGISAGCLIWGATVALGLGAMLAVSTTLFTLFKLCGALYLGGLGIAMLCRPRRTLAHADTAPYRPHIGWWIKGCLAMCLIPKLAFFMCPFCLSLFPPNTRLSGGPLC